MGATHDDTTQTLAAWLLAAWFVGLLVATPFYRPYPRLTLPWLVAAWLGAGAALPVLTTIRKGHRSKRSVSDPFPCADADTDSPESPTRSSRRKLAIATILLASLLGLAWKAPHLNHRGVPGWQDRTGLEKVAAKIIRDVDQKIGPSQDKQLAQAGIGFIVYVYAEPALFFHLSAANVVAQPVTDLEFAHSDAESHRVPIFLVAGPHALRSKRFAEQFQHNRTRLTLVREYHFQPSDLVLLNNTDTGGLATRASESVRLYRASVEENISMIFRNE